MKQIKAHSCTVCGETKNSKLMLRKEQDGRGGNGDIALFCCGQCQTIYLGGYSESFDEDLYAYYARYHGLEKEDVYDPLTRKRYLALLDLFSAHGCGRAVLDVGCGKGDFVDAALNAGWDVEGIELSQPAVNIAQGFCLPVSNLDFFSDKIKNASRDLVTMFEVIEHVPNPGEFFSRAEEIVKPGGLVYLTTPNFNSLDRRVLSAGSDAIHREHLTYFTPKTLINAVRKRTNLDVVHLETRNVSTQLIRAIRGSLRLGRLAVAGECSVSNPNSTGAKPNNIRKNIENSIILSLLKRMANMTLNVTSLGSTIVILLKRPLGDS
jgi:2-polyprenyl-3-methyl-5-hydroxy-6-metoxy-1,4-benzoquinol methylase